MPSRTMLRHHSCYNVESPFLCIQICAMLWNFDFFERIIGLNLGNNQKTFQEVRNRIFGKILSIIASSLTGASGALILHVCLLIFFLLNHGI